MLAAAIVAWLVAVLGDQVLRGAAIAVRGSPEERGFSEAVSIAVDAILDDIPDAEQVSFASALEERFDALPAVALDGRTRVRVGLIQAIGAQLAPLADAQLTPSGESFLDGLGVDPGWLSNELAEAIIRALEQVASGVPELTPLMVQLNADAVLQKLDEIHRDAVAMSKQLARPAAGELPIDLIRVVNGLMEVPAMADDGIRRDVVSLLTSQVRPRIPFAATPKLHVLNIVRTSLNYPDGLPDLIQAIRFIEGDSLPMRRFDQLIATLNP